MKYIIISTERCIFAATKISRPETLEDLLKKEVHKIPPHINERGEMVSSLILERFMRQVSRENIPEALALFRDWKRGHENF